VRGSKLINQIQAHIIDPEYPLSSILREAKVLASQLDSSDLTEWVSSELDGYKDASTLPNYRIIATVTSGTWTNGVWTVKNHGVPLFKISDEDLVDFLSQYRAWDGIRTIEELSKMSDDMSIQLPTNFVALVNQHVSEGGYGYAELHYAVGAYDFLQILDSVRNRLLDFILKLSKNWNPESPPPPENQVSQLVQLTIYNNPDGGDVTIFDQRGQSVDYQFNAAGNINIEKAESNIQFAEELTKLKEELDKAKNAGAIPAEASDKASAELSNAVKELKAPKPRKSNILDHIGKAKALLQDFSAAVQLVIALGQAADVISELLK